MATAKHIKGSFQTTVYPENYRKGWRQGNEIILVRPSVI